MHSASARFNSVTLYAGLILAVICAVNYAHARYTYNPQPEIQFEITETSNFIPTNKWEVATFRYNMHASTFNIKEDLSSLYTWNLKQLFVYI